MSHNSSQAKKNPQKERIDRLRKLISENLNTLIKRYDAGCLVQQITANGLHEADFARRVRLTESPLGKLRRFATDFSRREVRYLQTKGVKYTSILHTEVIADSEERWLFLMHGITAKWSSSQFRDEVSRRYPGHPQRGGRGVKDEGGRRKRQPPSNPGFLRSVAEMASLLEQCLEYKNAVLEPNLSEIGITTIIHKSELKKQLSRLGESTKKILEELPSLARHSRGFSAGVV